MKIKKSDDLTICQECGKTRNDNRTIYELDFGSTYVCAWYLCKQCVTRLWCNINLLIDEE